MKTPILGCGYFREFRPGFSLWHTCHVVRHGHFTLKQLTLPLLNEMHTNSCTGPRLNSKQHYAMFKITKCENCVVCLQFALIATSRVAKS